jgi:uncharacterized protein YneF (UPF0154 family)
MIFIYIGPGLGGGMIAAILGVLLSFILGVIALFWIPIKKLFRFLKRNKK